jgi:hypothetical protein
MSEQRIASAPALEQETRASQSNSQSILQLIKVFSKWFHLPNPGALLVVLGAYAANRMAGTPVWLLIVGPPSAGKTEILAGDEARDIVRPKPTLVRARRSMRLLAASIRGICAGRLC